MDALDLNPDPRKLARTTDPTTSKAGGRDVVIRAGTQYALLLRAFAEAHARGTALTRYEAGHVTGLHAQGANYWHRVGDLVEKGLLAETGETRVMPTGSAQKVVAITDAGLRVVEAWT